MKGKGVAVTICLLVTVTLFLSFQSGLWPPVATYNVKIPEPARHILPGENVNGSWSNLAYFQTADITSHIKGARKAAMRDPKALYLSENPTPPFDSDFKNPCWWYNKDNGSLACLPYFYLAGFPKSGTTDLYFRLIQHPLIAEGLHKEPHYVTRRLFGGNGPNHTTVEHDHANADVMKYATKYFAVAEQIIRKQTSDTIDWSSFDGNMQPDQYFKHPVITVDGSASTFWDNKNGHHIIRDVPMPDRVLESNATIADWVLRVNPRVKIVLIMREPASRVFSGYKYFKKTASTLDFDARVDTFIKLFNECVHSGRSALDCGLYARKISKIRINVGLYHLYIEQWLLRIPRDRIHFVRSEDYHDDMEKQLRQIFHFLELPQLRNDKLKEICALEQRNVNKRNLGPILPWTRRKLINFYKPFNKKLAKLLNNDAFLWKDVYSQDSKA